MNGGLLRSEREKIKGQQVPGRPGGRGARTGSLGKPGLKAPKDLSGSRGSGKIPVGFEMTTVQD